MEIGNKRDAERIEELEAENERLTHAIDAAKRLGLDPDSAADAERFNQLLNIPALQDELCWLFEIRSCDEDNLSVLKAKIVAALDAAREGGIINNN